jgi:hypothetical protein
MLFVVWVFVLTVGVTMARVKTWLMKNGYLKYEKFKDKHSVEVWELTAKSLL